MREARNRKRRRENDGRGVATEKPIGEMYWLCKFKQNAAQFPPLHDSLQTLTSLYRGCENNIVCKDQ